MAHSQDDGRPVPVDRRAVRPDVRPGYLGQTANDRGRRIAGRGHADPSMTGPGAIRRRGYTGGRR